MSGRPLRFFHGKIARNVIKLNILNMTEFKKYRNKKTGDEVKAKQVYFAGIGWWEIAGKIKLLSNNLFNKQYQLIENENDK